MIPQSEKVRAAFRALKGNVHFEIIESYLQECLVETISNLAIPTGEDHKLRFLQGELSVLLKLQKGG